MLLFKYLSNFASLDLSDSNAMDICTLLRAHAKTGVDNLDLSQNRITDKGFIELCKALNDTQISRFVVSNNKITDKCTIQASGSLMRNKHLKVLNM